MSVCANYVNFEKFVMEMFRGKILFERMGRGVVVDKGITTFN